MNKAGERVLNGLIKENPTFVLLLGMCPTLAVTTSAINGMGMGLSTMVVLVLSNMLISMLRKIIPSSARTPAFIVVVASFVTMVDFLLQGFVPSLYESLGIYIPLIVVNCIILGRAESYASKNPVIPSIFDGVGMGLGFTVALTIIGSIRELLGAGQIFGITILSESWYTPITIFILAPGAFFVLGCLVAGMNQLRSNSGKKKAAPAAEVVEEAAEEAAPVVEEVKAPEAPKAEAPKAETPVVESPKAEAPKVETPVVEAPKAEEAAAPAEAPKTEE